VPPGFGALSGPRCQPNVFNAAYAVGAATGVYANMDSFNRVTSDTWWADLATDKAFVDLDLAYDRDSNITSVTDNILKVPAGTRKFDAKYTMDSLNRVTASDEGNLSGGTITTASRARRPDRVTPRTSPSATRYDPCANAVPPRSPCPAW
jgi:hypothetical protein